MGRTVTSPATFAAGSPDIAYPATIDGEWVRICTDAKVAVAASVLLNPGSYSSDATAAAHCPLLINMGTRIRLIATYDVDEVGPVGPSVRVYGADKTPSASGVFPSGTIFWRLDASTFNAASTTLTLASLSDQYDANAKAHSTPVSATGYNLLGAKTVLVLTATAATASASVTIEAQVING